MGGFQPGTLNPEPLNLEGIFNMTYNIALIPGDGIGKEVVAEAVKIFKVL